MSPEVESLFLAVAELPDAAARTAYYEERKVPPEVRAEVESLVQFDPGATRFIAEGLLVSVHRNLHDADMTAHYGPYRIVKPIGSGGMGTVYLAERIDGEVVHKAAIKVLRTGNRSPDRIARFLRERQILASLKHPNIARLIDAGHRADGEPYLVMDYVEGRPVDEYATGLGIRQKIELMLEICGGVSYAHRNLVIHRDLKPSNILVDESERPHLLDFGIAKILDETAAGDITGQRMLTPDYSSPEQVCDRPVTTATDVYSLGGVLYKLLTGVGPHHFDGSTPEGVLAAIQNREPVRPSRIQPELRGDLDLILVKALRKDPEERYHTVDEFAADLRAYLESWPIAARKGEWTYRARKFLRRYWVPSLAAAVTASALVIGFAVANRQRVIAQRRFDEVRQLSNKLFDIEAEVRQLPGSTRARQRIVETALDYLRRLGNEIHGDPDLAQEVAKAHVEVANVQGLATGRNLGQTGPADENLKIAQAMLEEILARHPEHRAALAVAAQAAHDRMILAAQKGGRRDAAKLGDALEFGRKSAALLDRLALRPDEPDAKGAVTLYRNIADQLIQGRRPEEALQLCDRAMLLAQAMNLPAETGMFHWVRAEAHLQRGALSEAQKAIDDSVRTIESSDGPTHDVLLAHVLIWQGRILGGAGVISLGQSEAAARSYERAFQLIDPLVHADQNDQSNRVRLGQAGNGLGAVLRDSNPAGALEFYEHTLRHLRELPDNAAIQRVQVEALAGMAGPLQKLNRSAAAGHSLERAFELLAKLKLYPSEKVTPGSVAFKALRARAEHQAATGEMQEALHTGKALLAAIRSAGLDEENSLEDATDLAAVYQMLREFHTRMGDRAESARIDGQRIALWTKWSRKSPDNEYVRRQF